MAGLPHGFCGRRGGVSAGAVAGLNCGIGSGDDPALVTENRRLVRDAVLPKARLVGVYQQHSALCVAAQDWPEADRPAADALVTDRPGVLLSILTADCAPVLLADADAGVVGAAHAGWKGAIGGVLEATIAAMEGLGARREQIVAAIGPCIAQASYEVDTAFRARFIADAVANAQYFVPGKIEHYQFDLEGYVSARLTASGLAQIARLGLDTYGDESRFYSFRRATHRDEASYGRQISVIGLSG